MKGFVLFLVILMAILFVTNPSMMDFQQYVKEQLQKSDNVLISVASSFLSGSVDRVTERHNLLFLSSYIVRLPGAEYRYIGIAKTFIFIPPLRGSNTAY